MIAIFVRIYSVEYKRPDVGLKNYREALVPLYEGGRDFVNSGVEKK